MSQTAEAGFSSLTHGVITFSMASFVFTFVFPQPKDSKTFKTSLLVSVQPGYAKVKFTVAVQYSNSHLAWWRALNVEHRCSAAEGPWSQGRHDASVAPLPGYPSATRLGSADQGGLPVAEAL